MKKKGQEIKPAQPSRAEPPAERHARPARAWLAPLLIFLLAFAVRLIYLLEIRKAPIFSALMVDARAYDGWAQRIAAGDWLGCDTFYQAPLYPYFLGLVYTVFGRGLFTARLVQIVIGAFSCVLLAAAARTFLDRRTGIVAGLLLALYPPAVFFDGLIQKAVLGLLFTTLLLLALARLARDRREMARTGLLGAGIVLGAFSLTRENALVLYFLVLLWLTLCCRAVPWRRRVARAALFTAGMALVLLPVAVRNRVVGGDFLLTTAQFGPNVYIGNNEEATGLYVPLKPGRGSPEFERRDATELAEAALGRKLRPGEVSAYWSGKALAYIRAQPADWVLLMVRKWFLVWNAAELSDAEDIQTYRNASCLLRALSWVLHFGVICPLAFFGLAATWDRRDRLWILYLVLGGIAGSVTLFYVFARYRYPMVPVLVLFAAAAVVRAAALLKAKRRGVLLVGSALLVLTALGANWRMVPVERLPAATNINLGNVLMEEAKYEQAAQHYSQALLLLPDAADVHNNLGAALSKLNRHADAITHYSEAIRLDPDYPQIHYNLARVLEAGARPAEACLHYSRAIERQPRSGPAHYRLGRLLAARGAEAAALAHFSSALEAAPDLLPAHQQLALALGRQGMVEQAAQHYSAILNARPDDADTHNRLGVLFAQAARTEEAARHFSRTLELSPGSADAHSNLGAIRARMGDLAAAVRHYSEAIRIRPGHADALNNLGALLAQQGRTEEAIAHFSQGLAASPGSATAHNNLAKVHVEQVARLAAEGRRDDALQAARTALTHAERAGNTALADRIRAALKALETP